MSRDRKAKVLEAVKAIQAFHEVGRSLPQKGLPKDGYGQGTIAAEAEKQGMNPDTVRKARQFADPENGYSVADVKAMCNLIRKVQSEQDGAIFGRTHLIRMMTVPKKKRNKLQTLAIENGWSTAELERQISSLFGSRRDGGRKRRVPKDLPGALVQLEGLCESWQRWANAVKSQEKESKPSQVRHKPLLPAGLHKAFAAATKAIVALHEEVNRELLVQRPRRGIRNRFRAEDKSTA